MSGGIVPPSSDKEDKHRSNFQLTENAFQLEVSHHNLSLLLQHAASKMPALSSPLRSWVQRLLVPSKTHASTKTGPLWAAPIRTHLHVHLLTKQIQRGMTALFSKAPHLQGKAPTARVPLTQQMWSLSRRSTIVVYFTRSRPAN